MTGATPLVLLPGMDGTGRLFAPLLAALPAAIEPIVVTYPEDQVLGYSQLLALVRSRLPQKGRFFVLGESFSGPLALRLAAEGAPGLAGVILAASFVGSPLPWVPRFAHALIRPGLFGAFGRRLAAVSLGAGRCSPEVAQLLAAANAAVAPAVLAARARATLEVDLRDFKDALAAVPILVLVARGDRVVGRAQTRAIAALLPHALIQQFDAPHLLLQARPGQAAAAIAEFVL